MATDLRAVGVVGDRRLAPKAILWVNRVYHISTAGSSGSSRSCRVRAPPIERIKRFNIRREFHDRGDPSQMTSAAVDGPT